MPQGESLIWDLCHPQGYVDVGAYLVRIDGEVRARV